MRIAEHDVGRRRAMRRVGRHGMAVDQQAVAEGRPRLLDQGGERGMVGPPAIRAPAPRPRRRAACCGRPARRSRPRARWCRARRRRAGWRCSPSPAAARRTSRDRVPRAPGWRRRRRAGRWRPAAARRRPAPPRRARRRSCPRCGAARPGRAAPRRGRPGCSTPRNAARRRRAAPLGATAVARGTAAAPQGRAARALEGPSLSRSSHSLAILVTRTDGARHLSWCAGLRSQCADANQSAPQGLRHGRASHAGA